MPRPVAPPYANHQLDVKRDYAKKQRSERAKKAFVKQAVVAIHNKTFSLDFRNT